MEMSSRQILNSIDEALDGVQHRLASIPVRSWRTALRLADRTNRRGRSRLSGIILFSVLCANDSDPSSRIRHRGSRRKLLP